VIGGEREKETTAVSYFVGNRKVMKKKSEKITNFIFKMSF
jgi:hypothetical protein